MKPNKNSLEYQLALVSAPEDFPPQFRSLSTLDSTLRCPICREFYQAPVLIHIPKCCHTFCSACIRTCFNNDSNNQKIKATGLGGVGNSHRCPICKVEAQEEKIKPVPTLESAVICWQDARQDILNIISRLQSFESNSNQQSPDQVHPPSIIPHPNPSSSSSSKHTSTRPQTRSTRANSHFSIQSSQETASREQTSSRLRNRPDSKNSRNNSSLPLKKRKLAGSSVEQQDSGDDIQLLSYNPTDPSAPVECPLCRKQMLNSNMDTHITNCLTEQGKTEPRPTPMSSKRNEKRIQKSSNKDQVQEGTKPTQNRIPLPHFSSLKAKEIRAELLRHGLNPTGTGSDQIRRLSKYITLFNANLDAQLLHQKSIESIKNQVYLWENLQDSENIKLDQDHKKLLNNQSDYLKRNKSHFDLLTDQASKSLNKSSSQTSHPKDLGVTQVDVDDQPPIEKGDDFSNINDIDLNLLMEVESTNSQIPTNNDVDDIPHKCSDVTVEGNQII